MNNYLLSFLAGIAITILGYFIIQPNETIEPLDTSKSDSLLVLRGRKIDSLSILTDSLISQGSKIDTVYLNFESDLKNEYEKVDTTNNSDTLINAIKRTIQLRRTQRD